MVTLRDFEKAIELLAMVFPTAKPQSLNWFYSDTSLDPIRDDPRYKSLLAATEKRLGLSP